MARLFADRHGWAFHVLTEREIRQGFLLANLRLLRRYRLLPADRPLTELLATQVPPTGIRLGELIQRAGPVETAPTLYQQVLHLLCVGQFSFVPDLLPLDLNTLLFPKGAVSWDPFALW